MLLEYTRQYSLLWPHPPICPGPGPGFACYFLYFIEGSSCSSLTCHYSPTFLIVQHILENTQQASKRYSVHCLQGPITKGNWPQLIHHRPAKLSLLVCLFLEPRALTPIYTYLYLTSYLNLPSSLSFSLSILSSHHHLSHFEVHLHFSRPCHHQKTSEASTPIDFRLILFTSLTH